MNRADPLPHPRYGLPLPPGPSSPVLDSLLNHRSVRAFLDRPLEPGTLEALVAAASSAPTSSNLQAWSVVAVEDAARRERLSVLAGNQGFIRRAPLFLCWIADLSRLERLGEAQGRKLEGLAYLEAFMVALADAAIAAQNALVAAESLGLGTVYVGALRNYPREVSAELALPPQAFAPFGMCIGWPDPAVPTAIKPRLPPSVVLHRETYAPGDEAAEIAAYDARLADFSEAQGMGRADWSGRMLRRVADAAALHGRDTMAATLRALGFGLR